MFGTDMSEKTDGRNDRRKGRSLSELVGAGGLSFLMEAHDGLSAAIARDAGFEGLWASGLAISSALGYRDCNEASWGLVADVVERMVDSSGLPILVDGDTGFGNFNNARLFATKLQQRGAAGLCLEDKVYPKMNSFVGTRQPLAEVREFCGRLRAAKDAAPDLVLVARIEALIAGHGMDEALDRANAYAHAGADAVLIHSKRRDATEILDFMRHWQNRLPVVIVPTTYYATPASTYRDAGVATVIWANHGLRASIAAIRRTCFTILEEEGVASLEAEIATLDELFRLLNYDELAEAEKRYLDQSS